MATRKLKYGNKKVEHDGIVFDSKKEMKRWLVLREAEKRGLIRNLRRQVEFELIPKVAELITKHLKTKDKVIERHVQSAIMYVCDFQYEKEGDVVVEDTKISPKMIPADYRLKEKIFRWKYGFAIRRVYKADEEI